MCVLDTSPLLLLLRVQLASAESAENALVSSLAQQRDAANSALSDAQSRLLDKEAEIGRLRDRLAGGGGAVGGGGGARAAAGTAGPGPGSTAAAMSSAEQHGFDSPSRKRAKGLSVELPPPQNQVRAHAGHMCVRVLCAHARTCEHVSLCGCVLCLQAKGWSAGHICSHAGTAMFAAFPSAPIYPTAATSTRALPCSHRELAPHSFAMLPLFFGTERL